MHKKKVFPFFLLFSMGIGTLQLAALKDAGREKAGMESVVNLLKANKIEHYIFSNSQDNKFLVVPKFGARILAVSVGGENLFWTHPDTLKGLGGQRTWISPEGGAKGFIFQPDWKGNRDFSMMDPGNYKVIHFQENRHLALQNSFQTTSNDRKEHYDLTINRKMRIEEDPVKDNPELMGLEYQYLGIDFVHSLKNNSQSFFDRILDLWCLIQIPPKGTMIVPVQEVVSMAWRGNYFEPVPENFVKANPDSFSYFIHGSQRYKVGIRPQYTRGAICYLGKTTPGSEFMVIMTFPIMPSAPYVDKPKSEQEANGDAIQIYSHLEEGALAFGELECHSWGLQLKPGAEEAFPIKIYIYKSSLDILKKIGKKLVCSNFDKAYIF